MKFVNALIAGCLALFSSFVTVKAGDDIDIVFYTYLNPECLGFPLERKEYESGDCHNMDDSFQSYRVEPKAHKVFFWHHDDFENPKCGVAVYSESDCEGEIFTLGPFITSAGLCGSSMLTEGWSAKSVMVSCDGAKNFHPKETTLSFLPSATIV